MSTVFLLGAGFSAAANSYCDQPHQGNITRYPLASDLDKVCFPSGFDRTRGIEYAFAAAAEQNDSGPRDRLVETIQDADFYVGGRAINDSTSCFHRLIERFPSVDFLTF